MNKSTKQFYAAFLRGVNVGGKHKVPMAELRKVFEAMGFKGIKTLLNSGNVVFASGAEIVDSLEKKIEDQLHRSFGFPIPLMIRSAAEISDMIAADPFNNAPVTPDTRLFVSFVKNAPIDMPDIPFTSQDGSFRIIEFTGRAVYSILDVSRIKSTDAMTTLEKLFGKDITTRNWNTIIRVGNISS